MLLVEMFGCRSAVIDVNKKWEVKSIKRFEKKIEDA